MVGVYDWLSKQKYSFGIAEFNCIVGPFAIFEALGIENTFNVSATPFLPGYLQYLEIDTTLLNIPGILLVTLETNFFKSTRVESNDCIGSSYRLVKIEKR